MDGQCRKSLEKLHNLHNDLPFSPERMKIEKVEKLAANLKFNDKIDIFIHTRNSKQALNHGLVLKNVLRVIQFNQNSWLKPYIDMNTDLRKKAKSGFESDKIYLYAKDPYEAKYQLLINKPESAGLKHCNDSKAFIEYSNDMVNIYENIEENNPNKKRKILIVFDDVIADMLSNKELNPIVTELFIRGRKLNISLVFITESYFAVSKNMRINSMHYFILKTANKREPQQVPFNHSSDNPSRFRKNLGN